MSFLSNISSSDNCNYGDVYQIVDNKFEEDSNKVKNVIVLEKIGYYDSNHEFHNEKALSPGILSSLWMNRKIAIVGKGDDQQKHIFIPKGKIQPDEIFYGHKKVKVINSAEIQQTADKRVPLPLKIVGYGHESLENYKYVDPENYKFVTSGTGSTIVATSKDNHTYRNLLAEQLKKKLLDTLPREELRGAPKPRPSSLETALKIDVPKKTVSQSETVTPKSAPIPSNTQNAHTPPLNPSVTPKSVPPLALNSTPPLPGPKPSPPSPTPTPKNLA